MTINSLFLVLQLDLICLFFLIIEMVNGKVIAKKPNIAVGSFKILKWNPGVGGIFSYLWPFSVTPYCLLGQLQFLGFQF